MRAEHTGQAESEGSELGFDAIPLSDVMLGALDALERYSELQFNPARWEFLRGGERELISYARRRLIFERDGFCCRNCGVILTLRTGRLDHIVPWSAKGPDCSCNLRVLCDPCNTARSNFRGGLDDTANRRPHVVAECIECEQARGVRLPEEYPVILAYCGTCGLVSPADATMAA